MKSSRIALSLLLALQGAVVIALGNVEGQTGDAAQVDAREILARGSHAPLGPPICDLIAPDAARTPAALPGVDPLAVGMEMSGGITDEFDYFCYEYGIDYSALYGGPMTPTADSMLAVDEEPDPWMDHDQYFANYGYDSLPVEPIDRIEEEAVSATESDPNAAYLGFSLAYPEEENAYVTVDDDFDIEALVELATPDEEYVYDGEYEYVIAELEESEIVWKFVDPYDYYGSDEEFVTLDMPTPHALSRWSARDLLLDEDVLLVGRLYSSDRGKRRVRLQTHLEVLGWYAIDFAAQYEEATGQEVLDLSHEPIRAAAFLAAYRLYERGEVDTDEAIDLVAREDLSEQWLVDLGPSLEPLIAVRWDEVAENLAPVARVAGVLGSRSLVNVGDAILAISHRFSGSRWRNIVSQAQQLQSACRPIWGHAPARR